jgi:hypothetical protein
MHYHTLVSLNPITATLIRIVTISIVPLQIPVNYRNARTRSTVNRAENITNNYPISLKKSARIPSRYHSKIDVLVYTLARNLQK